MLSGDAPGDLSTQSILRSFPQGTRSRFQQGGGRRPCRQVADRPGLGRGLSGRQAGNLSPCARSRTVRPQAADRPRLTREHRRRFFLSIWRSKKASTYFLATPLGTTNIDASNRPSMAGSRDSSEVSTNNIITPTSETLPAEEQLLFEER